MGESECCIGLLFLQAFILNQWRVRPANIQAILGQHKVIRCDNVKIFSLKRYNGTGFNRVGNDFVTDPTTRVTRHRNAKQTQFDKLMDRGRKQHRHDGCHKGMIRLMRYGRRLGRMIITGNTQNAPMCRTACGITVFEDIATAVNTRPLAVPDTDYAILVRL